MPRRYRPAKRQAVMIFCHSSVESGCSLSTRRFTQSAHFWAASLREPLKLRACPQADTNLVNSDGPTGRLVAASCAAQARLLATAVAETPGRSAIATANVMILIIFSSRPNDCPCDAQSDLRY